MGHTVYYCSVQAATPSSEKEKKQQQLFTAEKENTHVGH